MAARKHLHRRRPHEEDERQQQKQQRERPSEALCRPPSLDDALSTQLLHGLGLGSCDATGVGVMLYTYSTIESIL